MEKKQITMTEKRFFEWHEDDVSVTLRNKGGSYGGGSEVLIISCISEPLEHCKLSITKGQTGNMSRQIN